jgi:hypothetical protein
MKGKLWDNDIESLQTLSTTTLVNSKKAYMSDNISMQSYLLVLQRQVGH